MPLSIAKDVQGHKDGALKGGEVLWERLGAAPKTFQAGYPPSPPVQVKGIPQIKRAPEPKPNLLVRLVAFSLYVLIYGNIVEFIQALRGGSVKIQ